MTAIDISAPIRPSLGGRVAESFRAVWRGIQLARMIRILTEMSDAQLSAIGVKRQDIPEYAWKLVTEN
jgi:uncharacterized protein YjiS (DUF1127 family)